MGYHASIVHVLEHSIGDLAFHFVTWISGAIERTSFGSGSSHLHVAGTAPVSPKPISCFGNLLARSPVGRASDRFANSPFTFKKLDLHLQVIDF